MKQKIYAILILISFNLLAFNGFSQCEPMTPEQCPDPENNGQICPDTLDMAYLNQFYSVTATIKPPVNYYLPPDSTLISLHHVKLTEVGNLPPGLTWQSNSPDSIFVAGEYYCVQMEGTPDSAGVFPLKITVDVYVLVFGVPVKAATVTDSTSLFITVIDNSGIHETSQSELTVRQNVPNPFHNITTVEYILERPAIIEFEVYTMQGKRVHYEKLNSLKGINSLTFDGRYLSPGTYFYKLKSDLYQSGGMMIRTAN